jgi:hypothetical protein
MKHEPMSEQEKARIKALKIPHKRGIRKVGNVRAFLAAYAMVGTIKEACNMSGCDDFQIRTRMKRYPEFADQVEQAKEEFIQSMESEAIRRAGKGLIQPVVYKGQVVEVWIDKDGNIVLPGDPAATKKVPLMEHKKSDLLMMFLLKSYRPSVYRENQKIDITSGDKPVKAYMGFNPDEAV